MGVGRHPKLKGVEEEGWRLLPGLEEGFAGEYVVLGEGLDEEIDLCDVPGRRDERGLRCELIFELAKVREDLSRDEVACEPLVRVQTLRIDC